MRRHVLSAGATIVYWLEGHGKASRARLKALGQTAEATPTTPDSTSDLAR
jgi:hypothetical protein